MITSGPWPRGLALLDVLVAAQGVADVVTYNAMLTASSAQWSHVLEVFEKAKSKELMDVITFGTVISSFEEVARWQEALALLDELQELRLQPNLVTQNAAMSCCEKSGKWQLALLLLEALPELQLLGRVFFMHWLVFFGLTCNCNMSRCWKGLIISYILHIPLQLHCGAFNIGSFPNLIESNVLNLSIHSLTTVAYHDFTFELIRFPQTPKTPNAPRGCERTQFPMRLRWAPVRSAPSGKWPWLCCRRLSRSTWRPPAKSKRNLKHQRSNMIQLHPQKIFMKRAWVDFFLVWIWEFAL